MSKSSSEYRNFLYKHVQDKSPAKLTKDKIDQWPDVNSDTDQGRIVNEIVKKFNNHSTLGINKVKEVNKNSPNEYGSIVDNDNFLTQLVLNTAKAPDPKIVAHEIMHGNDHQIDSSVPVIWDRLKSLNKKVANKNFISSVQKIQDKVDPTGVFKGKYPLKLDSVVGEINGWNRNNKKPLINAPLGKRGAGDAWDQMFDSIQPVVTDLGTNQIKNHPFFLNFPSEFLGFMSERLTDNWRTNENTGRKNSIQALNEHEKKFLYSTLDHMGNVYPAEHYPVTNHYIRQRQRSIDTGVSQNDPYKPPLAQSNFSEIPQQQLNSPPRALGSIAQQQQNLKRSPVQELFLDPTKQSQTQDAYQSLVRGRSPIPQQFAQEPTNYGSGSPQQIPNLNQQPQQQGNNQLNQQPEQVNPWNTTVLNVQPGQQIQNPYRVPTQNFAHGGHVSPLAERILPRKGQRSHNPVINYILGLQ